MNLSSSRIMDDRADVEQFTLNYKCKTNGSFQFIRKGDEKEPIPRRLRCGKLEHRQTEYENENQIVRRIDFYLDGNDCIDPATSSGWNELCYPCLAIEYILL